MYNKVSNRQIVFILFLVLTSISMIYLPKMMALKAGRGAWFTLLLTSLIFAVMAAIIVKLSKMHDGKVLFDYSRDIAGKITPYVLAIFYVIYFLVVDVYLCLSFTNILKYDFLPKTPQWATLISGIPLFGYIAYKGITNAARLIQLFGFVEFITTIFIGITMLFEGRGNHLLPVFNPSETGRYILSVKDAVIAFLGIEVLTIIPFTKENKKASATTFLSVLGIGLYYVLIVGGCVAMVGFNEIVHYNNAFIAAVRLVQYPTIEFLQRIDILYMTINFMGIFSSKAFVYLVIVEYLCRIFKKAKRLVIVLIVGVAIFILSLVLVTDTGIEKILAEILTYSGLVSAFIIPLILLLIAKVKNHAAKSQ